MKRKKKRTGNDMKDNPQNSQNPQNPQEPTPRRRMPFYAWIAIVLAAGLLIYMWATSDTTSLFSGSEQEVTYDTFLTQLEAGEIDEVEIKTTALYYTLKDISKEDAQAPEATAAPTATPSSEDVGKIFAFRTIGDTGYSSYGGYDVPQSIQTTQSRKAQVYFTYLVGDEGLVDRLHAAGVTFKAVTENDTLLMIVMLLLQVVLPLVLMIWVFRSISKRMGKVGTGGGLMGGLGKSNARTVEGNSITTKFKDVAGQDEAKESLQEIVGYLHDPKKYAEVGAKMPRGALLYGPPGTGKTLLARAVAGEAGVPFLSISGPEFVELFVGLGASKVRDLFKEARQKAPCIVFIDEIDAVAKKRDNFGGNDEREQTLNQLLSEMDGFEENSGVIVLASTNRPDSLDKALLRPGRFDRRVPVELPDQGGREAILKIHVARVKTAGFIDLGAIARITPGASGADLANVVNEAALCAVRNGRSAVIQQDLEDSVDVALAGKQRKSMVISQKEKRIIAYHEVGHAITAACQKDGTPVHKITIIPRTNGALGFTLHADEDEHFLMDKDEAFAQLVSLAGGRAAEELACHTVTTGASNDIEQATKLARAMITRYGMSDKMGFVAFEQVTNPYLSADTALTCSAETAALIDKEVMELVDSAYKKALSLLKENEIRLNVIAGALMEKETINGEEFMQLMHAALPEAKAEPEAPEGEGL